MDSRAPRFVSFPQAHSRAEVRFVPSSILVLLSHRATLSNNSGSAPETLCQLHPTTTRSSSLLSVEYFFACSEWQSLQKFLLFTRLPERECNWMGRFSSETEIAPNHKAILDDDLPKRSLLTPLNADRFLCCNHGRLPPHVGATRLARKCGSEA